MEKQSTEYDILIAKFAGWKIDNNFPDKNKVWRSPKGNVEFESTFKFSSDWNDLHQVIDKIEELGYFVMINKWTSVYTGKKDNRISVTSVEGKSKIINTYQAIIQFIKWFNEQQEL